MDLQVIEKHEKTSSKPPGSSGKAPEKILKILEKTPFGEPFDPQNSQFSHAGACVALRGGSRETLNDSRSYFLMTRRAYLVF